MKKTVALAFIVFLLFVLSCKKIPTSPSSVIQTASFHINSSPAGAEIWLDGVLTGKITEDILTNISVGTHTVKLTKEGYLDYSEIITAEANMTHQINASLTPHNFAFTSPGSSTIWVARKQVNIRWMTSSSLSLMDHASLQDADMNILGVTDVKIELFDGSSFKTEIVARAPNTGEYLWTIPKEIGGSNDYKIKISAAMAASISSDSNTFPICYDVSGTYKGTITFIRGAISLALGISYVQSQNGKEITGTWTTADGSKGSIAGTINKDKIDIIAKMEGIDYEYKGTLTIENYGNKLTLSFSGITSQGFTSAEAVLYR